MRYKVKDYVDLSYLEKMGFQKTYIDYSQIPFFENNDTVWLYELKRNGWTKMAIRIADREICIHTDEKMLFKMIRDGMVEEYIWKEARKKWQEDQ